MKFFLIIIFIIHGLIHFIGFAKAFDFGNIDQFSREVTKPMGVLWLLTGLLFVVSAGLNVMKNDTWPIFAIIVAILSQILIFTVWKDAKFGTIANAIIIGVAIIGFASIQFENSFNEDVVSAMEKTPKIIEIVTKKDLEPLPLPVKKYLEYVGVVGKPKIKNIKIVFEGKMRNKGSDWFKFKSEQFNFFENPARLFFMKAKVKGLPANGYHFYKNEKAGMSVRLFSLFPMVKIDGQELFQTETVTFFNDLCLFAPSVLIDDRISWKMIDRYSVKATFTNKSTSISALLYFNEKGQLVNFISDDRFDINQKEKFRFSTPVNNYKNINGYNLPTYGEAIWYYPDGMFVYGEFNINSITYNVID